MGYIGRRDQGTTLIDKSHPQCLRRRRSGAANPTSPRSPQPPPLPRRIITHEQAASYHQVNQAPRCQLAIHSHGRGLGRGKRNTPWPFAWSLTHWVLLVRHHHHQLSRQLLPPPGGQSVPTVVTTCAFDTSQELIWAGNAYVRLALAGHHATGCPLSPSSPT